MPRLSICLDCVRHPSARLNTEKISAVAGPCLLFYVGGLGASCILKGIATKKKRTCCKAFAKRCTCPLYYVQTHTSVRKLGYAASRDRTHLDVKESHHASSARAGVVEVYLPEDGHRWVQVRVCRLKRVQRAQRVRMKKEATTHGW